MASQWYSLVSQKLSLAKLLLTQLQQAEEVAMADGRPPAMVKQALAQASAEMLIRAQRSLLIMLAHCHQHKTEKPQTLAELKALFSYEVADITDLEQLACDNRSWWTHLEQLDKALSEPAAPRKATTTENVIAVAAAEDTDFSVPALEKTRSAMAAFARELEEKHSEW